MVIREFTSDDIREVAALEKEVFSDPWSETAIAGSRGYVGLAAVSDTGEFLGYIIVMNIAPESELLRLCVRESARRRGVAALLTEQSIDAVKKMGAQKMFLEVRALNTPARTLYERVGFKETGVRKNYYKDPTDDAVIMEKDI